MQKPTKENIVYEYDGEAEYPREFFANLEFRSLMLKHSATSVEDQKDLWIKCSRDILFYVNTFVYTYDPRITPNVVPMITYAFQDHAILRIQNAIMEGDDIAIEKSRDMGLTWIVLIVLEWFWKFRDRQAFLLLSRKEDLVDKTGDMDSLMPKLDFIHEHQPKWMNERARLNLHLENTDNSSSFDGETMNEDAGRGGRKTAVMCDEFAACTIGQAVNAALSATTNCRIFPSTPKGKGNEFYAIVAEKRCEILRYHWTTHPEKRKGIYKGLDGKWRSPWYDKQCAKLSDKIVAQEIDIDYDASDSQFFSGKRHAFLTEQIMDPYMMGELVYDKSDITSVKFKDTGAGVLKLWCYLGLDGRPPHDRQYVIGSDIGTGSGASDTVHSVIDVKTFIKVAEWQSNTHSPSQAAKEAVALGKFFQGQDEAAFLIYEANGPGAIYGREITDQEYPNTYYYKDTRSDDSTQTMRPGWYSTNDGKREVLSQYQNAIESDPATLINYSKDSIDQLSFYIYGLNGKIVHSKSASSKDNDDRGSNHGDNVMADAIAWKGVIELLGADPEKMPDEPEKPVVNLAVPGTLAHRHESHRKEMETASSW